MPCCFKISPLVLLSTRWLQADFKAPPAEKFWKCHWWRLRCPWPTPKTHSHRPIPYVLASGAPSCRESTRPLVRIGCCTENRGYEAVPVPTLTGWLFGGKSAPSTESGQCNGEGRHRVTTGGAAAGPLHMFFLLPRTFIPSPIAFPTHPSGQKLEDSLFFLSGTCFLTQFAPHPTIQNSLCDTQISSSQPWMHLKEMTDAWFPLLEILNELVWSTAQ